MKRILAAAALSIFLAVPAHAEDDPVAVGAPDAEQLIVHMETMASVIQDSGGDCDKLAVSLGAFVDEHGASIAELTDRIDALPQTAQDTLKTRFEARSQAAGEAMVEGLVTCSGHDGVMQAFERMEREQDGAAAASATPIDRADVEKLVVHMETMANLMGSNQEDCAAMAKALDGFAEKNKAELRELSTSMSAMPPEQQEAFELEYTDRLDAALAQIMQGGMACGEDPGVEAALQKLDF